MLSEAHEDVRRSNNPKKVYAREYINPTFMCDKRKEAIAGRESLRLQLS